MSQSLRKFVFFVALLSISISQMSCISDSMLQAHASKEEKKSGAKYIYELVSGEDLTGSTQKWDKFFSRPGYVQGTDPTKFLEKNISKLRAGKALILGMGEGKDGVFLAKHGFQVDGIDISGVALRKAWKLAHQNGVKINPIQANLKDYPFPKGEYDLILCVTYYRSSLIPKIKEALKPGGFVVFQNYLTEHVKNPGGLSVPTRFMVERGELKSQFKDFDILKYTDRNDGKEALAMLLAKKKDL